jgi:hypothetical protein
MQIKNYAYTAVKVKVKVHLIDSKARGGRIYIVLNSLDIGTARCQSLYQLSYPGLFTLQSSSVIILLLQKYVLCLNEDVTKSIRMLHI